MRKLLPAEEAAHVVSASTNEAGELVLVMDTPSWAARVRYCVARVTERRGQDQGIAGRPIAAAMRGD